MNAKYLLLFMLPVFLFKPLYGKEASKPTIVFDYGGVLSTAHKEGYYAFIAKAFSIPISDAGPLIKKMRKWRRKTRNEALAWELIAKERGVLLPRDWTRLCEAQQLRCIHERPKMMDLVHTLKEAGYQVAMLSNISRREACLVRKLGYYAPFDPVLLSCEIGVSKPKPKAFEILRRRLKKSGKQIIFIDDKAQNIKAAANVGIDGIQFVSYDQLILDLTKRKLLGSLTK